MRIINDYSIKPNSYPMTFKRNWQEHVSWGANYIKETKKANFKLFSFPDAKAVFVEIAQSAGKSFGNIRERIAQLIFAQGTALTIGALQPEDNETKIYPMQNKGEGIFEAHDIDVEENSQYRYIIVKNNNDISLVKDPYSKKQPNINGWSEIYNSDNYEWKATDWLSGKDKNRITRKPNEPLRGLENLIIEEINIPTLSEEGSFEKAKNYIDKIAERGIATAIEIMPVENTFSLQWGYDGVDKFAVNEKMGGAAKLKELIDYAHLKELNVIIDMVPNHIGPDGNYLTQTGPYVKYPGPFGDVPNFENKHNRYVRDWMTNAAIWWINEFKVDGLRLDMTKHCESDYLLKQIVCEINEHNPEVFLIAEDGLENRPSITDYEQYEMSHDEALARIDQSVENIANQKWHTYPNNIGFDSEWDFPLMHELNDSIIEPYKLNLDRMDSMIWKSKYRVKFAMSHDEIGNKDGTRLIPKVIAVELNLFDNIDGISESDRGQKAAKLAQKLTELYVTTNINNIPIKQLHKIAKDYGLNDTSNINPSNIIRAFNIGFAKQKLANASILTIPGPKMFFQGDDDLSLSQFKFFREFSNYESTPDSINEENNKKGYNTLERIARPDSIIDTIKPTDEELVSKMINFNKDLANIVKKHDAIINGNIVGSYKDFYNKIHIHQLKKGDEEILVIKNFGNNFHTNTYGFANFPQGNWEEVFNSDSEIYGGSNFVNTDRGGTISADNQSLNLAPNSVLILKRVS